MYSAQQTAGDYIIIYIIFLPFTMLLLQFLYLFKEPAQPVAEATGWRGVVGGYSAEL